MRRTSCWVLVVLAVLVLAGPVFGLYEFAYEGLWPKTWPRELEALRKQARTVSGPEFGPTVYEIPFANREQFEAAWPHILSRKSPEGSIILLSGPHNGFPRIKWPTVDAGVRIKTPGGNRPPSYAEEARKAGITLRSLTDIELVVDGEIVDLNRIVFPAETRLIDRRAADGSQR